MILITNEELGCSAKSEKKRENSHCRKIYIEEQTIAIAIEKKKKGNVRGVEAVKLE